MPQITDQEIQEAKRRDIVEVVESITGRKPKRNGDNLFYNCPFHNDKTPSFNVRPANNTYHCFGCGVSGNVITFVMEYLSLSFPDAVNYLNGKLETNVPIKKFQEIQIEKQKVEKQVANGDLLSDFMAELISYLTEEDFNRVENYLNSRKLSLSDFGWESSTDGFMLGLEPILVPIPKDKSFESFGHAKKELLKTYSQEEMQEHGLFGEKGSVYAFFDFFFVYYGEGVEGEAPITNLQARKIIAEKGDIREMFIKNKVVLPYNMHILSRLPHNSVIYLTEAPIDAVSLNKVLLSPRYSFNSGMTPFVVSTGGSTIKADRLVAIAKEKNMTVKLAMDNDEAGDIATTYWLGKLASQGVRASKFMGIPRSRKDPNDYLIAMHKLLFE